MSLNHHQDGLVLFVDNTGEMYDEKKKIIRHLMNLTGDQLRTVGMRMYKARANHGITRYHREIDRTAKWSTADIAAIARHWLAEFETKRRLGEYGPVDKYVAAHQKPAPKLCHGRVVK
jgi:hypothetical protein